jgi:hypothetical protein
MAAVTDIAVALLTVWLLVPVDPAGAECITPGRWLLQEPRVELVFSGEVVEIRQIADASLRITFTVDRLWKGAAAERFDLYVWQLKSENPTFERGKRYAVFAERMPPPSRQGVGLTDGDPIAFAPTACGALDYRDPEQVKRIRELGKGQPPRPEERRRGAALTFHPVFVSENGSATT